MTDQSSASDNALITAAIDAMTRAYAPYSKFAVGAAVRDEQGRIHCGANVENAAYPNGICAETAAIAMMVNAGGKRIDRIAVAGGSDGASGAGSSDGASGSGSSGGSGGSGDVGSSGSVGGVGDVGSSGGSGDANGANAADILCTPCGGCRQRIREFATPETVIIIANPDGKQQRFTLADLLPHSFGPENLSIIRT